MVDKGSYLKRLHPISTVDVYQRSLSALPCLTMTIVTRNSHDEDGQNYGLLLWLSLVEPKVSSSRTLQLTQSAKMPILYDKVTPPVTNIFSTANGTQHMSSGQGREVRLITIGASDIVYL